MLANFDCLWTLAHIIISVTMCSNQKSPLSSLKACLCLLVSTVWSQQSRTALRLGPSLGQLFQRSILAEFIHFPSYHFPNKVDDKNVLESIALHWTTGMHRPRPCLGNSVGHLLVYCRAGWVWSTCWLSTLGQLHADKMELGSVPYVPPVLHPSSVCFLYGEIKCGFVHSDP